MTNEKMLAAAKKAARRMARATGTPYQSCLDTIAQQAGRKHWAAFLADPIDILDRTEELPPEHEPAGNDKLEAFSIQNHLQVTERKDDLETSKRDRPPSLASRLLRRIFSNERKIVQRSKEARILMPNNALKRGNPGIPLGTSVDNRYTLQLGETLPVLAMAPPGSGKTAGLIIPTIVTCDADTLVIHDDHDVVDITSGYRSQIGPVTVLDLAGPRSVGSLNPLSASWLPIQADARRSYVNSLVGSIVPHDSDEARILKTVIHDLAGASGGTSFTKVAEALLNDSRYSYASAWKSLDAFLEPTTVDCTTKDGFKPQDLRGVHNGNSFEPATLYILRGFTLSGRQEGVAATIQAAIWWWTLSYRPGDAGYDGRRLGPCSTTVILDDVHKLAYMPGLAHALERGRATKLAHIVSSFGYSLICKATKLNKQEIDALFAVQVILPQNDPDTIDHYMQRLHGIPRSDLYLGDGMHLLALQYEAEPLRARTPFFFTDAKMLAKVYNPRTGIGPKSVIK